MTRSRIKLTENEYTKLLLNTRSEEEVNIRAAANLNSVSQYIEKNNLKNEQLDIGSIRFQKDDISNRLRFAHEKEILGFSCHLSYGEDHDFQVTIYLKINSLNCKSRNCNFTIKDKSITLICVDNKFYWEFIATKIH
jgi:hypothetical protein